MENGLENKLLKTYINSSPNAVVADDAGKQTVDIQTITNKYWRGWLNEDVFACFPNTL